MTTLTLDRAAVDSLLTPSVPTGGAVAVSYLRSAHYLQIFYLISQLPVHFMMMGVCLAGVQRALTGFSRRSHHQTTRRAAQILAWAVMPLPLLALVGWQGAFNLQVQDARVQAEEPMQIRHLRAAIRMANQLLAERPACDLVVVSEGHNLERSDLAPLREFTVPERVRLTDGRLAVSVPAPCAVYLDALPGSRASEWLATTATLLPGAEVSVLGRSWQFYDLPAEARADLVETRSP